MAEKLRIPGGALANRPLHFIWLCDCSGSMSYDGKIQSLNQAIREAIPEMRRVAAENPNAKVLVRVLTFSTGAQWHVSEPTPLETFEWNDLTAHGQTDMGEAFVKLAEQLRIPPMDDRALPPVLALISDGQPTDTHSIGLQKVFDEPWGRKAVRIAIAIGNDADGSVLERFIDNVEIPVLQANNPEKLVRFIKWASTQVLQSASSGASRTTDLDDEVPNIPLPETGTGDDVW